MNKYKENFDMVTRLCALDGRERTILNYGIEEGRLKAIEEFAERLKENYQSHAIDICLRQNDYYSYSNACRTLESYIDEITEEMRGAV